MAERPTIPEASRAAGVEPPVGTDVRKMSRVEFDRLSEERHWPRGDYDARRGLAEVVAEPTLPHESRAGGAARFVDRLCGERAVLTGALRIEWRGSVLEPDASFYFAPSPERGGARRVGPTGGPTGAPIGAGDEPGLEPAPGALVAPGFEEACRPEEGDAPPPLVVEINRSSSPARAAEKRADYFEMGVQEIWTWRPRDGASIYRRGKDDRAETVGESGVLPGVTREDLEELWAPADWGDTGRQCAAVVRMVRERAGVEVRSRSTAPGEVGGDDDG